jgi:GNAT superfamily N-acetyltransferase
MVITYTDDVPRKAEFYRLFETTGWNKKYQLSPEELLQAVENSWYAVSAYNGDTLVGFCRVMCDGVVHALILDLIVAPSDQGQGIGSQILRMVTDKCTSCGIRDIQLFSARGKAAFYEKNGYVRRPQDAPGMEWLGLGL